MQTFFGAGAKGKPSQYSKGTSSSSSGSDTISVDSSEESSELVTTDPSYLCLRTIEANLLEHPIITLPRTTSQITVGDLHGNSLYLLYVCIANGIISLDDEADAAKEKYQQLARIYLSHSIQIDLVKLLYSFDSDAFDAIKFDEILDKLMILHFPEERILEYRRILFHFERLKNVYEARGKSGDECYIMEDEDKFRNEMIEYLSAEMIPGLVSFTEILEQAKVDPEITLRLIGDELADRGINDQFTFIILDKLVRSLGKLSVLCSNHSYELFCYLEEKYKNPEHNVHETKYLVGAEFYHSLVNLDYLIELGVVNIEFMKELYESIYFDSLTLFDYSFSTNFSVLNLFSHAPAGLNNIKEAAASFDVVYDDTNAIALTQTIDNIRLIFSRIVRNYNLHKLYGMEFFQKIIWGRDYESDFRERLPDETPLNFGHGHDSEEGCSKNRTTLDFDFAKDHNLLEGLFTFVEDRNLTSLVELHRVCMEKHQTEDLTTLGSWIPFEITNCFNATEFTDLDDYVSHQLLKFYLYQLRIEKSLELEDDYFKKSQILNELKYIFEKMMHRCGQVIGSGYAFYFNSEKIIELHEQHSDILDQALLSFSAALSSPPGYI